MGKIIRKHPLLWIGILAFTSLLITAGCSSSASSQGPQLTILTTNDRHSNLLGDPYGAYDPSVKGDNTVGGASRLATLFGEYRTANPDTLVFDAGDFIDGTIFIAAENGAADLNMLKYLGYDAALLGNHEMSMGPAGLAQMISNASAPRVPLLCSNIVFSSADTTLGHSDDALEAMTADTEGGGGKYIFRYIVRTTASGYKVGIIGLLGVTSMPDALPCTFPINYPDIQTLVDNLRNTQDVDVVVCLMHAGLDVTGGTATGVIADLARNVSGIDVICAGHSHTQATAKVAYTGTGSWTTTIIESGDKTKYVGRVNLSMTEELVGVYKVNPSTSYAIVPVNDSIIGNATVNTTIGDVTHDIGFISDIETNYLTNFTTLKTGKLFDVLANSPFTFGWLNSMNMVSDAMRSSAGADVALCTRGADTALVTPNSAGDITVYDAFSAMPHGMGRDNLHGGPLYKFYFVAAELQGLLELGTCYMGQSNEDYFVVPSGIKIIFNTTNAYNTRISKMYLVSADEGTETLIYDTTDQARAAYGGWRCAPGTDYGPGDPYQLLSVSTSQLTLIGLKELDLYPRNSSWGTITWDHISELDSFRVLNGYEVKAWYSVAEYLDSFSGSVPTRYEDMYTNGSSHNPIGPAWRRVWNVTEYGNP